MTSLELALQATEATGLACLPPFTTLDNLAEGTAAQLRRNNVSEASIDTTLFGACYASLIFHQCFVRQTTNTRDPLDFKAAYSPKHLLQLYKAFSNTGGASGMPLILVMRASNLTPGLYCSTSVC